MEPGIFHWTTGFMYARSSVFASHVRTPHFERYLDLPREVWIAQAGTAVSTRVRVEAWNSVNVIR